MRTTVSDILLFQKCPYAWYIRNVNKRISTKLAPALTHGTEVHSEFQKLLEIRKNGIKLCIMYPEKYIKAAPAEDIKNLEDFLNSVEVLNVEEPIVVEVGGHTIDARPDGRIRYQSKAESLWQLKTSSANKKHHIDIVRYSVHECIYSMGFTNPPIDSTMLCRYIKTPGGKVRILLDKVVRTKGDVEAARQYVVRICDLMEEMTLGTKTEGWQTPSSCIDWVTGNQCDYFNHCHYGADLLGPGFAEAPDRYITQQPGETCATESADSGDSAGGT